MKLFGGSANKPLTEAVAKSLNIPLSLIDVHLFPDGERRIRIHDNVANKKTAIVQTASTPVDTNYMELFFIVDALRRSGAKEITAVVPYFGYQRQDHVFREGEAVSLEVVIKILESLQVDKLISVDMHSAKIPDLFHIPVMHLSALPLFAKEIRKRKWNNSDTVLVSPDMGGIKRVKTLSKLLDDMDYAVLEKNRDLATGSLTMDEIHEGSVAGKKRAIIVDDMISSGGTIILAATKLRLEEGIEDISVFATHPIFSIDAPSKLQNSILSTVFVTDTVIIEPEKQFPKLEMLSLADSIAHALTHPVRSGKQLL